ncbi:hypothetical protein BD324DRAFT_588511 [Kockovaella imperatae]|uniref:Translation initiation factor eIF2B subunit delta n=1 Tax=Kockovaella imperatae TaxID=4999 RepID=A0A1Y1UJK1_9TREE|nr:hypothetical protein BD324DRAFT_588511 [Kockovaella imperatae]ORX38228.1 hypothetical protein BD324DRAFT_588511 [Kockovaella imperatae]
METAFFSHLPNHSLPDTAAAYKGSKIHPAVIQAGIMMSSGEIRGANARTMATMLAFQQVIEEYQCPEQTVLWKDLPNHLSPMIAWLEDCRPKGVGGGNAIRWLKGEINRLGEVDMGTDIEQKRHLVGAIDDYLTQKIEFADQIIISHAQEKIKAGDTIVTYARSSIIEKVLLQAWRRMKEVDSSAEFRVIVVDSRPLNEGRSTLYTLTNAGIPCTYTLLPLASSVLPNANLVLVGASALHSDGSLYSRAGTAVISMLAKEYRVPVVACVETYKFGERVSLDSVASNEIGEPEQLLQIPGGKPFQGDFPATLTPLNLMYDLTPANLITTLCTELGFIPPSSVPTVLGKTAPVV